MKKRFGLQFEIVVSLLLLMAAALLFSGFLLLKLAEQDLVQQRVAGVREQMLLIAGGLSARGEGQGVLAEGMEGRAQLLRRFFAAVPPEAWFLADEQFRIVASGFSGREQSPLLEDLRRARFDTEPAMTLDYPYSWFSFAESSAPQVTLSLPLTTGERFSGVVQARFSLADVREHTAATRGVFLLYVGLYGGVLFLFGLWLLGKTVVRPVRALIAATRQVAAGNLQPALAVDDGPAEFSELAESFNAMTSSLQESRAQTVAHIHSLEEANAELRRTRAELLRSENLASVGRLAAGMAHEIGNPLGAVLAYLELIRSQPDAAAVADIAERAKVEAGRIDRLVRDLLDYAAPEQAVPQRFDPLAVLREARELLQYQGALDGMEVKTSLPERLPAVKMGRHKLLQVCVNLLLNARDAAPGGVIELSAGHDATRVWLAVRDNGPGIAAADQERIFDPFFTTKAPGRGRGLGLSVCHRIMEEAGGGIEVAAAGAGGSTFLIRLPQAGEGV